MNRRTLAYYASICGALTLTTLSLVEDHPAVLALSFPMGALMFVVVWLAGWRPRRGRT